MSTPPPPPLGVLDEEEELDPPPPAGAAAAGPPTLTFTLTLLTSERLTRHIFVFRTAIVCTLHTLKTVRQPALDHVTEQITMFLLCCKVERALEFFSRYETCDFFVQVIDFALVVSLER